MSKLEEKLKELGYEGQFEEEEPPLYYKQMKGCKIIVIDYYIEFEIFVDPFYRVDTQQDIDNIQQAFNVMQKDLEVLKEYESN